MTRFALWTFLTLAAAAPAALACPNCKEAVSNSGDPDDDPLRESRAFNNSIYLMLAVPYTLVGVGGFFGARLVKGGADVTFIARGAHLAAMREFRERLRPGGTISPGGRRAIALDSVEAAQIYVDRMTRALSAPQLTRRHPGAEHELPMPPYAEHEPPML